MDEIFRFFIAYNCQTVDEYGNKRDGYGRTAAIQDHDIRTIDDVLEIEEAIKESTGNTTVTVMWWKRFADMPAQVD